MIHILGMMTGTSCDGLDAACLAFDSKGWRPLWTQSAPYPVQLRKKILALQAPQTQFTLKELFQLNAELGEWYGQTARELISGQKKKPHVIANHGQTIGHFPAKGRKGTTVQLGDPTRLSFATGLTTVSHFRDGDLAAGGQGAPLVPLYHGILASHLAELGQGISIHNIGGISNLTYISPQAKNPPIAFDTGPGNIWIDLAASLATKGKAHLDRDGKLADRGVIDLKAIRQLLKHPYFAKPAPKSTGRDDFPFELLLKATAYRDESLVATATALTVESIGRAYEREILNKSLRLDRIFICGGGAHNPVLMRWLRERLEGIQFLNLEDYGLNPQFIEAQAFSLFGFLSLKGIPIGGTWTGLSKGTYAPPGLITPGKNWDQVLKLITRTGL